METQNETKAKKFIQKVMEHLNPDIKTDEDFTKYATSQWIRLFASKSNLCSSDLDKLEECIKYIIQSSIEWKEQQMIEKACGFIDDHLPSYIHLRYDDGTYNFEAEKEIIEDLKQAMKGE